MFCRTPISRATGENAIPIFCKNKLHVTSDVHKEFRSLHLLNIIAYLPNIYKIMKKRLAYILLKYLSNTMWWTIIARREYVQHCKQNVQDISNTPNTFTKYSILNLNHKLILYNINLLRFRLLPNWFDKQIMVNK